MTVCTFPGKHGDCLWALPTVRALAQKHDEPVDLIISPAIESLAPLLREQAYIRTVTVDGTWQVQETAPMTPQRPPNNPVAAYHLGYEGWPSPNLPQDIARRAGVEIDLTDPWITTGASGLVEPRQAYCVAFTDEWFELKLGVTALAAVSLGLGRWIGGSHRWRTEADFPRVPWQEATACLLQRDLLLTDNSAVQVLAVATGCSVVMLEPNPHRHNEVFFPLGKTGKVELVLGSDGQPTFDSRHVIDRMRAHLQKG